LQSSHLKKKIESVFKKNINKFSEHTCLNPPKI
jgi:hypothetical protein